MRRIDYFGDFEGQQRSETFHNQVTSIVSQLRDKFSMELAFLLDDDNTELFIGYSGYNTKPINEVMYSFSLTGNLVWDRIKDDFIPFLQRLDNTFDIEYYNTGFRTSDKDVLKIYVREDGRLRDLYFTIQDILQDKDCIPKYFSRIDICFKLRFD